MQFEHEIALVYNHGGDVNIENNGIWKENFVQCLSFTLEKITHVKYTIPGIDLSAGNIQEQLNKAKLVILLIDDPFLESNVSDQILQVYAENQVDEQNALPFAERLLPIIASNLPREMFPDLVKGHQGYDFSSVRLREKMIQEKQGSYGHSKSVRTLWLKILDLANDIQSKLARFEKYAQPSVEKSKTIYLAETTPDLVDIRDEIKRDLKRHGYKIVPNHLIPRDPTKAPKVISQYLAESVTSIHLIGEDYGEVFTDNKSVTDLQNKLAEEQSAKVNSAKVKDKFYRIIWINPEAQVVGERQKRFTDNIKRDIESKQESELLQSPIEELKAFIRSSIGKRTRDEVLPVKKNHLKSGKRKSIYLIYDRKDYDTSETMRQFLTDHGFEVLVPVFDGDFFELEDLHKNNLIFCDACMVIANNANKNWLTTKLKDIDKIHGFGRIRPIKAKAVYLAPEYQQDINLQINNGTIIINHEGHITDKVMEPFLKNFITENE